MKDCEFLEKYGSFLLPMFSLSVIPVNLDLLSSKNIKRNPVWGHMLAFSVTSELKAGGSPVLRDSRDDWITWIDPSENPNQDTNTEELKYYMVSSRNNQCNSCKLCSTMSSMIWSCATDSLLSEWEAPTCRAHSLPIWESLSSHLSYRIYCGGWMFSYGVTGSSFRHLLES